MALYFIALIPHAALRKEIRALKDEININSGAKKALNSPAHITLQRPFKRDTKFEGKLISKLKLFAETHYSFTVSLSGFDCFEPRVIFVAIQNSEEIQKLHTELNSLLVDHLDFESKEISTNIHPHITIATRDLSKKSFCDVWPTYKDRKFIRAYTAKSIFLLKHNGKSWNILQEFLFKEDQFYISIDAKNHGGHNIGIANKINK